MKEEDRKYELCAAGSFKDIKFNIENKRLAPYFIKHECMEIESMNQIQCVA